MMIPPGVDRALRAAHPTGHYGVLDADALDEHLTPDRIESLLAELRANFLVEAEIAPPEPDYDRSFVCYVGLRSGPGWHEFNREFSEDQRLTEVRNRLSPLVYWVIQLSRLGPYWTGYWNSFEEADGRISPATASPPDDADWLSAIQHVSEVLHVQRFEEIGNSTLGAPVAWLDASDIPTLRSTGKDTGPTVYECLFSEIY